MMRESKKQDILQEKSVESQQQFLFLKNLLREAETFKNCASSLSLFLSNHPDKTLHPWLDTRQVHACNSFPNASLDIKGKTVKEPILYSSCDHLVEWSVSQVLEDPLFRSTRNFSHFPPSSWRQSLSCVFLLLLVIRSVIVCQCLRDSVILLNECYISVRPSSSSYLQNETQKLTFDLFTSFLHLVSWNLQQQYDQNENYQQGQQQEEAQENEGALGGGNTLDPSVPEPPSQIPETSFVCEGKPYDPGMYADEETGCRVFHMCYMGR